MNDQIKATLNKVPEVTLLFWIIKIAATTLGETGGDSVSMSMNLGYVVATAIFAAFFVFAVGAQVFAQRFNAFLYWTAIIASTTVGTTMADWATRDLGIGYAGGSTLLLTLLIGSLAVWRFTLGTISFRSIHTTRAEVFYWVTIMFSQTLGTALGDWVADGDGGLGRGYGGSALIFGGMLLVVAMLYYGSKMSRTTLFWSAFILTRPLGAVVGDFLDKPIDHGGLALSRYAATAVLFAFIAACVLAIPQRAAERAH